MSFDHKNERDWEGGYSCNVLFKQPGVWVYRGVWWSLVGAVIGADQWCLAATRPLWPLGKATSGRTGGVRQGVVCIAACLHNSAQMWASSSQVQQVSRFSKA